MCSFAFLIVNSIKKSYYNKTKLKKEENNMKQFKIFIASSNDEAIERSALKQIINNTSKITEKYGVEIVAQMWELMPFDFKPNLERKQNEYNEALETSNMAFFCSVKELEHTHMKNLIQHVI